MEILKKLFCISAISLTATFSFAQNEAKLQKAFSDSYTQEYSKKYSDAISSLLSFYNEDSYEINLRLGWLEYMNKNYAQSINYYQKAVNLKPYAVEAKLGIVKPLSVLENWDKVVSQYEEILKIDPQNYTANYWAGVINYNRKKYEQAGKLFEKLVNLYPFDYDANHMLAWSFLNAGRINDAKLLFQKALLIRPGDTSCLEGLSKIK